MIDTQMIEEGVKLFLRGLGVDLTDQHYVKTPYRVAKAWKEFFGAGYEVDPKTYLNVEFSDAFDQMIVCKDIPLISHCSHHIVPFVGTAKVGYLPANQRITGLSKLARVVQAYASRLQIQEQLTRQIAQVLNDVLTPKGCGVIIEAEHFCMSRRGARATGSKTVTSYLMGSFRDEPETRAEFLRF